MRVQCPVVVGREPELAVLCEALARARSGDGAAVFLAGVPGIGKSALAREAVRLGHEQGVVALVGRAVPRPSPMPYRALTEALLSAVGDGVFPADPELAPFRAALGRLVPQWRVPGDARAEESPVVLGAGILRFLRAIAPRGSIVVLDDVHWADPDTMAVIEYLCDNVAGEPIVVLGTLRPAEGGEAGAVVEALRARGSAGVVPLEALDDRATAEMVQACVLPVGLDGDAALELVGAAEGVPLFVEELLTSSTQPGGSARRIPSSVAETVRLRLAGLDTTARRVLGCAALLGRRFDWTLLAAAATVDEDGVVAALRCCVDVGLIDDDPAGFRFRHALVRDAVLAASLRPEVARMAAATAAAVARAHPGLPGEWCLLAADLAEQAGHRPAAASLLVKGGWLAAGQAALGSAERLARRALALGTPPADGPVAQELLAEVLAATGRVDAAAEVVGAALDSATTLAPSRAARLVLVLVRAAVAAERWQLAEDRLGDVREAVVSDPGLSAQVAALAGQIAIGRGEVQRARGLAADAVAAATVTGSAEAACTAWEVVGRAERLHSLPAARAAFEQLAATAQENGLALWQLRATHELGTIDMLTDGRIDTLERARGLAAEAGALTVSAVIDLQLAGGYHLLGRDGDAGVCGGRAAQVGRQLRVAGIERAGTCLATLEHALHGDRAALERAISAAERVADGDGGWLSSLWGDGRASRAMLTEDRTGAIRALERAAAVGRSAARLPSPWWGLWALMRALRGADAQEALREVAQVPVSGHNAMMCGYTEAVLLGRAGHSAAASVAFDAADAAATPGWWGHLGRRVVAEAALEDGWGDPVGWLSAAAVFFDGFPAAPVASACRSLLRRAGAPVARRLGGVPAELAERGVTAREAEILTLLGEGLSNRDVATRLYLSPRTVEKHVENLGRKIGAGSRSGLVAYAAARPRPAMSAVRSRR